MKSCRRPSPAAQWRRVISRSGCEFGFSFAVRGGTLYVSRFSVDQVPLAGGAAESAAMPDGSHVQYLAALGSTVVAYAAGDLGAGRLWDMASVPPQPITQPFSDIVDGVQSAGPTVVAATRPRHDPSRHMLPVLDGGSLTPIVERNVPMGSFTWTATAGAAYFATSDEPITRISLR